MRDLVHPADNLVRAMARIYQYRMTTTSGGNLSIRDDDGSIWITPARVDKGALDAADIVRVRPDGNVEGRHRPSSEFPFHELIYQARPDLRAIVHAHPVALVAFSICGAVPDTRLFAKARDVCGEVGFAPYALPGSRKLGEHIAGVFAEGHDCVMLENHGVVIGGADFDEAFRKFETLEFVAKTIIKARALGEVRYLSDAEVARIDQSDLEMERFEPAPATSRERELRRELCKFIRRGYHQRLLTANAGSFSARLGDDEFLISTRFTDRATIAPSQLALIRGGKCEAGLRPSRACELHRLIYQKHPGIHAIVNATPVNATAFSASAAKLDTRTIPESYIFLRDVVRFPYDAAYQHPESIAAEMTPEFPIALLDNDGALVLGTSILDAFDRLEVLESTAEAVILSRSIGEVTPMGDEVIDELIGAFLK
ncbi:MAG: class II aldolase/adducin family protein [Akkermansiaceae bacterium]|nr:class II aldolase/adducin family protein [Akkermansiaceae bacterium]